jgi:hypothetical protein
VACASSTASDIARISLSLPRSAVDELGARMRGTGRVVQRGFKWQDCDDLYARDSVMNARSGVVGERIVWAADRGGSVVERVMQGIGAREEACRGPAAERKTLSNTAY